MLEGQNQENGLGIRGELIQVSSLRMTRVALFKTSIVQRLDPSTIHVWTVILHHERLAPHPIARPYHLNPFK